MRTMQEYRALVDGALPEGLRSAGEIPEPLLSAMRYSLEAGGKRIRPVLLLAACEMAGGDAEAAMPFACALEMIHTYSLIHDDLPAMDNDDLRRGRPTNHKVFGEDVAILAGDALLNTGAQIMARAAMDRGDQLGVRAMEVILRRAGASGMIAGQTADVTSEGNQPTRELVTYIHLHKTADLLQAPMEAGLVLAGAEEEQIALGREFALHFGLAFQMTDDLLDVTGDAKLMGKNTGVDAGLGKMTWVALKGLEGARQDAEREVALALTTLDQMPWDTGFLGDLARGLTQRKQ